MGFYYRASLIKILLTNAFLASIAYRSLTTPLFENRGNNYIANRLVFVKYLQFWRMIVIVIKDARKMDRNITAHILYNLFHYMYLIENLFYPKIRSPVWSKEKLGYISIKETQRVDNDSNKAGNIFFHVSGYFKYTVSFWFHLIKYTTTPTVLRSLVEYLNIMAVCIFCLHLSKLQSACMYHKMELKSSFRSFISHVVQNMQYL